ncbi:ribosome-recycling factor [bacterium BMS3Abin07]|nr:ribosome-recycling factor [bacterium BMS3Abin07]GBE31398.1 ribosome-recycling factor [bacterium BMS3Bbin05]HDL20214.1 ribosome recycling factor [Nitrospirota bacterium]HDO22370.1 ribosome recycling factor [Nitrospirota bacterium]HDZ87050.1 ribosome recycling factor [Nitrospirota bacterium]
MDKTLQNKLQENMEKSIEFLRKDFGSIRTGRAALSLLDGTSIAYYGNQTPINQVATLSVPDPRTIAIQPWEQKIIADIEKAIMRSDLDLTPTNDGKVIRINIPPLTEERRKQLVKVVKKRAEECKVSIRNIRREINEELKKMEKQEHISEDEIRKSLDEVQKITNSFIEKVEEVLERKEKEIMEV